MKVIAVTSPTIGCDVLNSKIYQLKQKKVSHVYLRDLFLFRNDAEEMIQILLNHTITPLVSLDHMDYTGAFNKNVCVHLKEGQFGLFDSLKKGLLVFSISVHSFIAAEEALKAGFPYVLISPVFPPLSKPGDCREILERKSLSELVDRYGERVVLLGGMTQKRVDELRQKLNKDFSYAGITMFWRNDDTYTY